MNDLIRVSAANLAKISLDNKFLVALNKSRLKKGIQVYTPFGGAIEFSGNAGQYLQSLGANFEKGNDLRFIFSKDKLEEFEAWFNTKQDRETTPYRELQEELVKEEKVLNALEESALTMQYLGTSKETATTDRPGQEGQLTQRYLEIFDVGFAPEYQETLENATHQEESRLALVTAEEIEQGKTNSGLEIATNCIPLIKN
tara:strand:+ start:350 stop:949 length:600 start_codon:yes stop_codon:yes gene_type:complete